MTLGMRLKRTAAQKGRGLAGILYGIATPAPSNISEPLLYIKEVYLTLWKAIRETQLHLVLFSRLEQL